ncbi:MAG: autotransporter outer membrane beta-barrel domain-containing protein [Desulfovibrio sp.]
MQDASNQGITIRGGTISITREAEESHSIVFTGYYAKEGHIDIEGGQSVTIGTPDRKHEFAVQGFSQGNGFSTIDINTNSKGTVTINGRATAESAEVNIHYAGGGSLQNGDVLAAKSHQGSKDRFTEGDKLHYGGPGTKTGVMNLVFSGAGAGMKGNMTAEEGSSITADFSGDNAFFNGNITAQKGERFTEGEKSSVTVNASRNAKLTGNVSVEDGGVSNVNLSGESLWTGKSALSGTEAASNVSVNDNSTWKVTADSAVSTLKLSGGTVDLEGGAHQIKIGHLSADGTPGTFRMDMTYHDNQLSTYENAKDSDFLYVGGGEGQTFRVEAADNSSLNSMKDGDKLYFARTASGAAEFDVDHKVLIRNPDKIYNKVFRVKTEAVTSEAAAGDNTSTAASSGSVTGDSADTAAPAKAAAGARAKIATASMAAASAEEGAAASSGTAASAGEGTAASSEAGASGSENTTASSENNEDAWYLTPETTAVDNPLNPSDNAFIPNANAYVPGSAHNAAASIWRDNDTLLKRLGELRWSKNNDGAWGRVINRRLARSGTQAFDVSMNTLQLGYDRRIPLSFGDIFVGGAIEHSRGTEKYDDGDGSVYMTDGALYGTFKGRSGDYVDVVTKAGKLFTHYSSDFGDGGDFENWGFSASAEYGHKFDLGWSWSVEPQAQIKYSYLWGDDYTSDNGAKIYQDDMDSLVGRLGLLVAKEFGTGTENPVRIYAKGSVLHEFLGDRNETLYQDVAMHDSTDLAGTWYSAGVGANVGLSENCSLYVDAEEDFGTDIKVQYRIQGGFRFEF